MKTKYFNNYSDIGELSKHLESFLVDNKVSEVVSFNVTSVPNDSMIGFARFFAILIYKI